MSEKERFKMTITEDNILDVLMHTATREDIARLDSKIDTKIDLLRQEIKADMGVLKTELKADMGSLRTELKTDIAKVDGKVDRLTWFIIVAILVPIAIPIIQHLIK